MVIVLTFWGALIKLEASSHVHSLTSYPCQWTRYSKHSKNLWIRDFFDFKFLLRSSIFIVGGGQICLLGIVNLWKCSRIKTWNIGWILIDLGSFNQYVIKYAWPIIRNGLSCYFSNFFEILVDHKSWQNM